MTASSVFIEAAPNPEFDTTSFYEFEPTSAHARENIQRLLLQHVTHPRQQEVLEQLMDDAGTYFQDLPLEAFIPLDPTLDLEDLAEGRATNTLTPAAAVIYTFEPERRACDVAAWLLGRKPRCELAEGNVDLQRLVLVEDAAIMTADSADDDLSTVIELGKDFGLEAHADPERNDYVEVHEHAITAFWYSLPNSTVMEFGLMHEPVTDRWVWLRCSSTDIINLMVSKVVDGDLGRDPSYRRRVALKRADSVFSIDACDRCGWVAGLPSTISVSGMFTELEFIDEVLAGRVELPEYDEIESVLEELSNVYDGFKDDAPEFTSAVDLDTLTRFVAIKLIKETYGLPSTPILFFPELKPTKS